MAELDFLLHDYLSKGRPLHGLDVPELERRWFAALAQAQQARGHTGDIEEMNREERRAFVDSFREMNYIEAELQLRGLKPPPPPNGARRRRPS